eukprot:196087-Hanusia_phi.AAC.1
MSLLRLEKPTDRASPSPVDLFLAAPRPTASSMAPGKLSGVRPQTDPRCQGYELRAQERPRKDVKN